MPFGPLASTANTTSPNATAAVRFFRRRCDREFLGLAQAAGEVKARRQDVDRKAGGDGGACRRPTRGRSVRVAHGARPGAARSAIHVAH